MSFSGHFHEIFIALLVRIFLGLLFFLQGYDKVFKMSVKQVIQTIHTPLSDKGVPEFISTLGAYFTSYIELICGAFLVMGFLKYFCLYLLGFDLLFAAIAFGIVEPLWDMKHVFPRFALLIFLLIIPSQWDLISVDNVWSLTKLIKSTF